MKDDMRVELFNPDEVKNLFRDWGKTSAICYASNPIEATHAPDENLVKIGKSCRMSNHNSGGRGTYFKFLITGVSRSVLDQLFRHEIGVFKNMQSFRYVGKDNFSYDVPDEIKDNRELLRRYDQHMTSALALYRDIAGYIESKGKSSERAHEQARYVLPMATYSACVIGFTYEALVHLMNERLCVRAEDRIHHLATLMRDEVLKVLPDLKPQLVPKCEYFLYCTEGRKSCGRYPTKQSVSKVLSSFRGKNEDFMEKFNKFVTDYENGLTINTELEADSFSHSLIGGHGGTLNGDETLQP